MPLHSLLGASVFREIRRKRALFLHRKGWSGTRIAQVLGVSPSAVSRWLTSARQHGWRGLNSKSRKNQGTRISPKKLKFLVDFLKVGADNFGFTGPVWTASRVASVIQQQFGVRYHPNHIAKILHKLNFSFQKTQKDILERDDTVIFQWVTQTWPSLRKTAVFEQREIVFVDESAFYLTPHRKSSWSEKGHPLHVMGQFHGEHLSVIGAVTWHGRLLIQVHRHACHGEEVVQFLAHILGQLPGKIMILWDNGAIHKSKEVQAFLKLDTDKRLRIEEFPSYAPELNPQEYIWRQLKYDDLVNRTTYGLESLREHLKKAVNRLRKKIEMVKRLVSHAGLSLD